MLGIIPAAGLGTRLLELGKHYPKAILPYNEKPLIYFNILWMIKQGCTKVIVVVSENNHSAISGSLGMFHTDINIEVEFIIQKELNGLGSCIANLKSEIKEPILIVLGDILVMDEEIKLDYSSNFVSVQKVHSSSYSRWCMVDESGNFYDKPKVKPPTDYALSGIYYIHNYRKFTKALMAEVPKISNEYQLSSYLQEMKSKFKLIEIEIKDFGTLSDFLANRPAISTRHFNDIRIDHRDKAVFKSSQTECLKLFNEFTWYSTIHHSFIDLSIYVPDLLSDIDFYIKHKGYIIEQILHPTLRELLLFFNNDIFVWEQILLELFYINKVFQYRKLEGVSQLPTIINKIKSRVDTKEQEVFFLINRLTELGSILETDSYVFHGDMCFSNVFFDINSGRIKLIDPRGEIWGSKYYDFAKIAQSIFYFYDFIDSGLYYNTNCGNYFLNSTNVVNIVELFQKGYKNRFTEMELEYIDLLTASLFLTMIPLHSDKPQNQTIYKQIFQCIVKKYYMCPLGSIQSKEMFGLLKK